MNFFRVYREAPLAQAERRPVSPEGNNDRSPLNE